LKILFLTDNFPPENNAPATRTFEHCKIWAKKGADVTVITGFPNFPNGKVFDGYQNKFYSKEKIEGVNVIRVWTYIAQNKGFFKRTIDYLSYSLMSFVFGLNQSFDVVIGTSPQFFTAISARLLSFFKCRPWIMEVRDLWPESISAVGLINKNSLIYKFLSFIEFRLYNSARGIVVVTDSFKNYLLNKGLPKNKIIVVKNGYVKDFIKLPRKNYDLIKNIRLENKFIISYTGTHGMAHGLDFIIKSIKNTPSNFHFIFQGDGAEKQNLISLSRKLNLKNVTFLSSVSKKHITKYLNLADVALVNLKKSDTFKSVIPSKIFENVALHKPILLGVDGESKKLIEKYRVGISFYPEDKDSFLDALNKICQINKDEFKENADKMLVDFDRKVLASKMLDFVKKISI
jgi:glycosyltransferase involved in cell wall biosynthesis